MRIVGGQKLVAMHRAQNKTLRLTLNESLEILLIPRVRRRLFH